MDEVERRRNAHLVTTTSEQITLDEALERVGAQFGVPGEPVNSQEHPETLPI